MGPPLSAFPMAPQAPTITVQAAGEAVRDLKRSRNSRGSKFATTRNDEYRLARRSRKMASDFQGAMEKSVKRQLNSMSGSQHNRKLGLKVSQFIPGKGLEVPGAQVENDPSIYCSLGVKGEKHVDPLDETFARIKGRQVSMDFAFKLINDTSKLLDHDKDTRVTTLNCFRHVNPASFDYKATGWTKDVTANTGSIVSFNITNGGTYVSSSQVYNPSLAAVISSNSSIPIDAQVTPVLTEIGSTGVWELTALTVVNGGSYFASGGIPTITFTMGSFTSIQSGGSEATATTNILFVDGDKAKANFNWHSTLGPDASLIRVGTSGKTSTISTTAGTWRGQSTQIGWGTLDVDADAPANSLMSPFRYPTDMEVMYSRINRQLLENYGWLLNPFKFINPTLNSLIDSPDPTRNNLKVWSNPGASILDFTDDSLQGKLDNSYPAKVNIQTDAVETQQSNAYSGAGFEWHSQFGPGKLNYQFSNDGTNPVCIDICVVGVKKDSPIPVHFLEHFCDYNYAVHKFANKNSTNVNGFQTGSTGAVDLQLGKHEWHKNAKLPFMPDACFKNPQSYIDAANQTFPSGSGIATGTAKEMFQILEQGRPNPFKVVKRDQFIVSSGSSRSWNTTLPSINYRPQLYEDTEYPAQNQWGVKYDPIVTTADEYTFILCIGASGMPKPVEEIYSASKVVGMDGDDVVMGTVDAKAIIDRQPSTCNVSVVGTYKETVYPCFPKDRTSVNFINGRLTEPYFENPPGYLVSNSTEPLPSRVNTVDISQLGQVVHVTPTGIVGVGAITTDVGA